MVQKKTSKQTKKRPVERKSNENKQSDKHLMCSNRQLQHLFSVSNFTICDWVKRGMPKEAHGVYDFGKVLPWWLENIYASAQETETTKDSRERYWAAKAEDMELIVSKRKGDLIPREKVVADQVQAASDLRQTLLAFPSRMAPILVNKPTLDIAELIKVEVFRMLENFCRNKNYSDVVEMKKASAQNKAARKK